MAAAITKEIKNWHKQRVLHHNLGNANCGALQKETF